MDAGNGVGVSGVARARVHGDVPQIAHGTDRLGLLPEGVHVGGAVGSQVPLLQVSG